MTKCQENSRLFESYLDAVKLWEKNVAVLTQSAGSKSGKHADLVRDVSEARIGAAKAKQAYNRHVSQHGCS